MSPKKNRKSNCDKKRKKDNSTDIDTSSEITVEATAGPEGEGRRRDSTPHKRSKTSVSRDRTQTKLTFQKTNTMNDTVIEKLDNLQAASDKLKEMIEHSKMSLSNKIDEKIEILSGLIFDLQKENDELKKAFAAEQKQSATLREEVTKLKALVSEQKEEQNELQQYSRRESVRIHGIKGDNRGETNEECEQKVLEMFKTKLGLDINSEKLSAVHRVGKPDSVKSRSVLVKFISRKEKDSVIKERRKLKGSGVVITDDLTKLNVQRLNRIRQHEGVLTAWSAAGGKLFAKLLDTSIREIQRGDTDIIDRILIGSSTDQRPQRRQLQQRPQRFNPSDHSTPISN